MTWEGYEQHIKGKGDPRLEYPYAILFFKVLAII
jgi:hypothetical protein